MIRLNCSLINVLLIISSLYLFTSINLLLFYLFYEFGLLLIFYLVVNWGYIEKIWLIIRILLNILYNNFFSPILYIIFFSSKAILFHSHFRKRLFLLSETHLTAMIFFSHIRLLDDLTAWCAPRAQFSSIKRIKETGRAVLPHSLRVGEWNFSMNHRPTESSRNRFVGGACILPTFEWEKSRSSFERI